MKREAANLKKLQLNYIIESLEKILLIYGCSKLLHIKLETIGLRRRDREIGTKRYRENEIER
jgi:hypothetical protein